MKSEAEVQETISQNSQKVVELKKQLQSARQENQDLHQTITHQQTHVKDIYSKQDESRQLSVVHIENHGFLDAQESQVQITRLLRLTPENLIDLA